MKRVFSLIISLLITITTLHVSIFAEQPLSDSTLNNPSILTECAENGTSNTTEEKCVVITYGTFDLLHYGHINLLKRAKALGDYLIVVLSTDDFNWNEKRKKCFFTYEQRKLILEALKYVDLVVPEVTWEQKRNDMHEYNVSKFVMGDDWDGKFDYLKEEGVEVVYLPRTPAISTTQIKQNLSLHC